MSLSFNDTSTFRGIVQIYEKEIGVDQGYISGNTARLKHFVADVNLAWDDYVYLALKSSGTWQFDDSNHTDYPIIFTDLVANQQDYSFTTDENGNLILDIFKVAILKSATDTIYQEIYPIDQQTKDTGVNLVEGNATAGIPEEYDKTGNGIFLSSKPSYSATNGLKLYINREASYFTTADTTKKPGCPGIHHRYFAIKPALDYARRNQLQNYSLLREEVVSMEGDEEKGITGSIERYFSRRQKDEEFIMQPEPIIYE